MKLPPIALAAAACAGLLVLNSSRALAAETVGSLQLGDTITGTVTAGTAEVVPFDATNGTLLDIDLKMSAGSGPGLTILQPDRVPLLGLGAFAKLDAKNSTLKIRKLPLDQSGRHFLIVSPTIPGTYKLTVKGKPLAKNLYEGFVNGEPPTEVVIGAVPGTLLTITAKAAKGSALAPKVMFVRGPGGQDVDLGTAASHSAGTTSDVYRNLPLPALGPFALGIGTVTGLYGDYGTVTLTLRLPKPKKAKGVDGQLVANPFVKTVQPVQGFDNLAYPSVQITGDFFAPAPTVTLEGPATIT